jgi:hypothetical protein
MNDVYIFTGPTIPPREAAALLDAVYLPPVKQGDVLRVTGRNPVAIGIIDGYFEHVPSVRHKEVLWAMAQGIHVFGASSMGALRAAELTAFGMEGVGKIFEDFRCGRLEDDDEVVVTHGLAEVNYLSMSEAMVNIRYTLQRAVETGVVSPETGEVMVRVAKGLFYPERTYPRILQLVSEQAVPAEELLTFRGWLPKGRVDQKREDAVSLLRAIREKLASGLGRKQVAFSFAYTDVWGHLRSQVSDLPLDTDSGAENLLLGRLLDEVRLCSLPFYTSAHQGAMLRLLLLDEAHRRGMASSREALAETTDLFRLEHGLLTKADVEQWLRAQDLTYDQAARFLEEEDLLKRVVDDIGEPRVLRMLPNYLRKEGSYADLLSRAREKQQVLASWGIQNPSLADAGLSEKELFRWYFQDVLGTEVEMDIEAYASRLGFKHKSVLVLALLREYCYRLRKE